MSNVKICLVTGATAGIGKVTAQTLAQEGAKVIIVSRSKEKCTTTVSEIKEQTANKEVEFIAADLSSQQEIYKLADEFKKRYSHLDILVNNAGAVFTSRETSADKLEMTFALNHLNYFLLTNLLIDPLKASPAARIVNVSSMAHESGQINFDDLQSEHRYSGWGAYCQSKLANVLFTYELASRLKNTKITANALHPGVVGTNFGSNNRGFMAMFVRLYLKLFSISDKEGAQTSIYLATSPEVENVTGKYFVKKKVRNSAPISYNQALASRLWQVSMELTKLKDSI
ncbi:MAG: SDR family oxidoreductase [Acidobacteria bacterium]|nr:SDR family oxidoreductase [Acidobacteriota bacterium]